jgi:hypothetical protein
MSTKFQDKEERENAEKEGSHKFDEDVEALTLF